MAKTYSLYEAATGMFTGKQLHCSEEELLAVRLPVGTLAIEGMFDPSSHRVEIGTGRVVSQAAPASAQDGDRRAAVCARILALESTQARALREAALGDTTALKRLQEIDTAIGELRTELKSK